MKTLLISALVGLVCVGQSSAQQYPTIVGEWYVEAYGAEDCGTPFSVKIGPMSYGEDSYVCSFDDVRRDGWQVTWNGRCSDGSSDERVNLVALETAGQLSFSWNGNPRGEMLRRCTAQTNMAAPVEKVPLQYTEYPGDSEVAKVYWPEAVVAVTEVEGRAKVAEKLRIFVAEAGGYTFVSASSMFNCGMYWECPIKIAKDGVAVGYVNACTQREMHAISADGSRFFACEAGGQGRLMASLIQ